MSMEDSLFPLSPRDVQKLGDDSMECAAADLLLGVGEDSLFNDSCEDMHVSKNTIRVALADPADDKNERSLDDSLDLDETQLPALDGDETATLPLCVEPLDSGNASAGGPVRGTAQRTGFQVADNIPVSAMHKESPPGDVSYSIHDETTTNKKDDEQTLKTQTGTACKDLSHGDGTTCSPPSSTGSTMTTSKVVPSFGTRKSKSTTNKKLSAKSTGKQSKKASTAKERDCQKEENTISSGDVNGLTSGDNQDNSDQCVPESTGTSLKPQKPVFASTQRNKSPSKNATSDQIPEIEKEGNGPDAKPAEKSQSKSETKEKKLAAKEQKKQEREEKKREVERKKLEREQKKHEAEEKKVEKERLKKERQFELERRRAEREQTKIELALKKAERMVNRKDGQKSSAKKSKKKVDSAHKSTGSTGDGNPASPIAAQSETEEEIKLSIQNDTVIPTQQLCDSQPVREEVEADVDSHATTDCGERTSVCGVTPPEENATLPENHNVSQSDEIDSPAISEVNRVGMSSDVSSPLASAAEPTAASLPPLDADEGACDVNPVVENLEQSLQEDGKIDKSVVQAVDTQEKENNHLSIDTSIQKLPVQGERLKIVFGKKGSVGANVTRDLSISLPKTCVKSTQEGKISAKKSSTKPKTTGVTSTGGIKKKAPTKSSKIDATVRSKQRKRIRRKDDKSEGGDTKRSKPSNYTGPVWVQCERPSCQKWRQLSDCTDPLSLPDSWNCTMNTDPEKGSCSAAEEHWSEELGDSQEFVETPFIPGSLVWAKMDSYPWWPAMVEEDPNKEAYYEMGKTSTSSIPVKYHVVFFDTPISRGWVSNFHIHPYIEDHDHNVNTGVSVSQKLRRGLKEARKQANRASTMTITMRLVECSFSKRFRRMAKKRKTEEDTEMETYGGRVTLSGSSTAGRKSIRLCDRQVTVVERGGEGEGEGICEEAGEGGAGEVESEDGGQDEGEGRG